MKDKMVAAGILATIALGVPLALQPVFAVADHTVKASCMEDEPCWDCKTMGNKVCGPNNAQGLPQIIEGCHWDGKDWIYWDQSMCRGTGEDPTTNSQGRPVCADQIPPSVEGGRVMCLTV